MLGCGLLFIEASARIRPSAFHEGPLFDALVFYDKFWLDGPKRGECQVPAADLLSPDVWSQDDVLKFCLATPVQYGVGLRFHLGAIKVPPLPPHPPHKKQLPYAFVRGSAVCA